MEDGGETWHLGKDNKGEESEATGRTDKTVMHVQEERLPCTNRGCSVTCRGCVVREGCVVGD